MDNFNYSSNRSNAELLKSVIIVPDNCHTSARLAKQRKAFLKLESATEKHFYEKFYFLAGKE